MLNAVSFDLCRFPALRHFTFELEISFRSHLTALSFLSRLLSISSSASGIETLEITITWDNVNVGRGKGLFLSGWSRLDEVLSSENFTSLRKVVMGFGLEIRGITDPSSLEFERNLTLPYANALFPMFRALTNPRRTLEIHVKVDC